MKNTTFRLDATQTNELSSLFHSIAPQLAPNRTNAVILQLARNQAVLSRKQLYFICINIANLGVKQGLKVPEWALAMLDETQGEDTP